MIAVRPERPQDGPSIEALLDRAFGGGRRARPSYRLREGVAPVGGLCLVAEGEGGIVGTIRYWPIVIGTARPALLLGPVAVDPTHQRRGIGRLLVRASLEKAAVAGHEAVVAVGTPAYLGRFGFASAADHGIDLPGLDEPRRLLSLSLAPGALDGGGGAVARVTPLPAARRP